MPIHLVPYLLSSTTSASLVHPNALFLFLSLVFAVILRRWSNGRDLIARLYIRAKEEEVEEERRLMQKQRMGKADADVAQGVRMRTSERALHGMTFLVVCNFTPTSLLLLSTLSSRGAQLILLLPSTSFSSAALSSTMQYLQLLRDGTNNDRIYAESCDMLSLSSIEAFCFRWNEGEGGGGTGAGPAGGRAESGLGGMGNAGLGSQPDEGGEEGGGGGGSRAPRRCDGLVLLPYTLQQLALSATTADTPPAITPHGQALTLSEKEVLGRFHLINSLLSTLLLLPPGRDIRILNWVSPWYAAGVRKFEENERAVELSGAAEKQEAASQEKHSRSTKNPSKSRKTSRPYLEFEGQRTSATVSLLRPYPSSTIAPAVTISTSGSATLQFLLLLHELQRRLILLAEADPRPRNPLPGIMPMSNDSGVGSKISSVDDFRRRGAYGKYPNVNVVNICPGFERDGEAWQYIWPSTSSSVSRSWTSLPLIWLRRVAILLLWPFLGLVLAKSPKSAADQFLWGLVAPIDVRGGCIWVEGISKSNQDNSQATVNNTSIQKSSSIAETANASAKATASLAVSAVETMPEEDAPGWRGIQPGRVYREGKIVSVLPLTSSPSSSSSSSTPPPETTSKFATPSPSSSPSPSISTSWFTAESLTARWQVWENRARRRRQWEKEGERAGVDVGAGAGVSAETQEEEEEEEEDDDDEGQ